MSFHHLKVKSPPPPPAAPEPSFLSHYIINHHHGEGVGAADERCNILTWWCSIFNIFNI
jgi:hypothetical protein